MKDRKKILNYIAVKSFEKYLDEKTDENSRIILNVFVKPLSNTSADSILVEFCKILRSAANNKMSQ